MLTAQYRARQTVTLEKIVGLFQLFLERSSVSAVAKERGHALLPKILGLADNDVDMEYSLFTGLICVKWPVLKVAGRGSSGGLCRRPGGVPLHRRAQALVVQAASGEGGATAGDQVGTGETASDGRAGGRAGGRGRLVDALEVSRGHVGQDEAVEGGGGQGGCCQGSQGRDARRYRSIVEPTGRRSKPPCWRTCHL
jgi:hypothetical protein